MKNKGLLAIVLTTTLLFISGVLMINKVDAVSLQYQVVQPNGQISHADQYMDKPANVLIKDGKYYVSMTSSIPSWIGSHPVTYTSINNGDGQIVNNAHGATFKFSTSNLNQLIPVTMHLDVKVANVNMDTMVYLKFLNVPAADSANGDAQNNDNKTDNNNTDANSANADQDANKDGNSDQTEKKVKIEKPVKLDANKSPKKTATKDDSVIYPEKQKAKKKHSATKYVAIGSGVVVLAAAITGIVYYHKKHR